MKKVLTMVLALALILSALPAFAAGSLIEDVWLECEVVAKGHKMKNFHLTVSDASVFETLTKDDFTIIGKCERWGSDELGTFTADINSITVDGNNVILNVINFNEKYFFVDSYTVLCLDARLTFTKEDLSREYTPIVDEFEEYRVADGAPLNYNLFAPADTSVPQPLVLALHGGGDYLNLLQNRVVVNFAEPYAQSVRPCYVMGPIFQNMETMEGMDAEEVLALCIEVIQGMIDDGKVDGNRVYVTGKSWGGTNSVLAMLTYPDFFAAGIPMAGTMTALVDVDLTPLKDANIWFVVNDGDSQPRNDSAMQIYNKLVEMGNESARIRVFTAKEMNVLGYDEYHAVDMQVHANEIFYEWLFAQSK